MRVSNDSDVIWPTIMHDYKEGRGIKIGEKVITQFVNSSTGFNKTL